MIVFFSFMVFRFLLHGRDCNVDCISLADLRWMRARPLHLSDLSKHNTNEDKTLLKTLPWFSVDISRNSFICFFLVLLNLCMFFNVENMVVLYLYILLANESIFVNTRLVFLYKVKIISFVCDPLLYNHSCAGLGLDICNITVWQWGYFSVTLDNKHHQLYARDLIIFF